MLLRFADRRDPLHPITRAAVRQLRQEGRQLHIASQNGVEFWNVATRPAARNGFGLRPTDAEPLLRLIERLFPVLPDGPAAYAEWRHLVVRFGVAGVQVHDARLVATMLVNGITDILTFNASDFTRYESIGVVAVDPATL